MTIEIKAGKRYVLANGAVTDPIERNLINENKMCFDARINPPYIGVNGYCAGLETNVYWWKNGDGIGGDIDSPDSNKNPDFKIVAEFPDFLEQVTETTVVTKTTIKSGIYNGVNIVNDGKDIIIGVDDFYVNGNNLDETINTLLAIQSFLKGNKNA